MHTKTLDEIGRTTGVGGDKASDRHNYLNRYEPFFEPLRDEPIRLLEIGIENGFSAKMWLEYFPNATIYGVDILPQPPGTWPERFVFEQGDQTSTDFWATFLHKHTPVFDIIIDDGSHKTSGIQTSFEMLFDAVRMGGYYIIEDLSTAYMAGYAEKEWPNQMGVIFALIHDMNGQLKYRPPHWEELRFPHPIRDFSIDWIQCSEELAIIKKK